jgi:hypothetical protein
MYDVSCKYNITYLSYLSLSVIFQLNSKTTPSPMYVYVNFMLCFDVKNLLLKSIQAF